MASGLATDPSGNSRGWVKRLGGTLKRSVIPPRIDCRPSVPDVSPPLVGVPAGQVLSRTGSRTLRVTAKEGVRVSVRVVGTVSVVVGGVRRVRTFNLASGSASSVRAGTLAVPMTVSRSTLSAMNSAAKAPGARRLGVRAYVVAKDTSANTRKVSAAVSVR